ncbi:amine sulfotransferase-like isoform X2 [Boleophthalmus pectinirostris]|nr:amine sulfotransferase-like isoform X2 [Boleophthalmus pectinirostris]
MVEEMKNLNLGNKEKLLLDSTYWDTNPALWRYHGFPLVEDVHLPHEIEQIRDLEIRDSDVFVVTYPKSGTSWMQQILLLLLSKGDIESVCKRSVYSNFELMSWIEVRQQVQKFINAESPRFSLSHLLFDMMPTALGQKKGKVIYVARNPKDIVVSYYYFHKIGRILETPKSFDDFFDKFLNGEVMAGSWFDHIKTWYSHRDELNMLFITYEEMIMDLKSAVKKTADFLEIELTEDELQNVVKHSTFENMKQNPKANYKNMAILLDSTQGSLLRKGTIGDWKNHFTVSQNERFDKVFEREMKDFPVSFIWDIRDNS